ncbi:replication protein A 70 kDa DNA-binding subunit B-like [Senna tora]|uniref:Replication protein A 70 kDa DNA-binding subunit B-like n=1 Tax=Senna tora TaxID=362788 RepID=A0A834TQA8_9FABA|nr:replication protein A 70 kDa DNA-binding subunit B-like [Senna tora]
MCKERNHLICSITPFREDLLAKAHVVRLWSVPKNCSNNSPPSNRLEMILCDSQNNKICASIDGIFERRFNGLFNEGEVIIISLFAVARNNGTFRMKNHQYRIIFQYRTKVQKSSDDVPIQYFGFDFVNLRSIRCGVVDTTLLIIFRTFIRTFSGGRIIVAIQWCKVAEFHGSKYVTTSMEATRLLINEDITRFDDLPVEFQQLELKPDNFRNIHLPHVSSELSKEPFADIQLNTISELYISSEYSVHFILATVIKVNTSTDWYYYACDFCMEELDFEDDCYYCYSCGKSISTPSIRFKINVEVVDTTGWARLIILDPNVSNFFMTDASKLLHRELSDDTLKDTNVLENLVHKVFLFKIFVNEASCVPRPSFEVITMSWDASLIEKLSDKYHTWTNINPPVVHTNLWESKSVCINGIIYLLSYPTIGAAEQFPTILRFDLADEIFSTISGPTNRPVVSYIPVEFKGSLAIIFAELQGPESFISMDSKNLTDKNKQALTPRLNLPSTKRSKGHESENEANHYVTPENLKFSQRSALSDLTNDVTNSKTPVTKKRSCIGSSSQHSKKVKLFNVRLPPASH